LSEGPNWKKHRKIISQSFHFEFLKEMVPIIAEQTQQYLDSRVKGRKQINFKEELAQMTGNIVSTIFFGNDFGS